MADWFVSLTVTVKQIPVILLPVFKGTEDPTEQ